VVRARYLAVLSLCLVASGAQAQPPVPALSGPVNDFASMIDPESRAVLERRIRLLQNATGDVLIVATIPSYEGYGDIRELAVKMFENARRGIGAAGKDNGILIVVSKRERRVAIEVGYGLEGIITDGFAGETIRDAMLPEFKRGQYGRGLIAAVDKISRRLAEARGVTLEGAPAAPSRAVDRPALRNFFPIILFIVILLIVLSQRRERRRRWPRGRGPWSGWHGGVGPFGGGPFGGGFGGFGGGGFGGGWGGGGSRGGGSGGGFGGFGGGRSGGGGAAGGW
jgi:uncharacterized protein